MMSRDPRVLFKVGNGRTRRRFRGNNAELEGGLEEIMQN